MNYKKKKILCLVKCYLPGYKYGGPIRTIANFVENFGNKFDIRIICDDRDFLDTKSYKRIKINHWNKVGKAKVFYLSAIKLNLKSVKSLLNEFNYDLLYLNSFFTFKYSILPIFLFWIKVLPRSPCIIAPRGEFSFGALKLKKLKKFLFIFIVKIFGFYNNLYWQASSTFEKKDIKRTLGRIAKKIYIAPNLVSPIYKDKKKIIKKKNKNSLKILFLSRISPMKNLDFLMSVLSKISKDVEFNIFGPKNDILYWNKCKKILSELPKNIKVKIGDEIPHKNVHNIFSENDLFAFPTKGEALGHIILESLSAATPVLVSDKTSWISDNQKGLQAIPLDKNKWIKAINDWVNISDDEIIFRRKAALKYANKAYLDNLKSIDVNKKLFYQASMRDK